MYGLSKKQAAEMRLKDIELYLKRIIHILYVSGLSQKDGMILGNGNPLPTGRDIVKELDTLYDHMGIEFDESPRFIEEES
jgi:hypothetical protein